MEMKYIAPDGTEVPRPDIVFLEQRIRNEPAQYWNYQTCIATIQLIDTAGPQLIFAVRSDLGVLVHFCSADGSDQFVLTQAREQIDDGKVSIFYGGDNWLVPRSYFVSVETALSAMAEFLSSQRRLSDFNWIALGYD